MAVRFWTEGDGAVFYNLYADGDGDGVRNRDIADGTDPPLSQPRPLQGLGGKVRFGIPHAYVPRDPSGRGVLKRRKDPVRFNNSDLASFSPLGGSTPGSLYFTDGYHLSAVRVFGRTGKVKVLHYHPEEHRWY